MEAIFKMGLLAVLGCLTLSSCGVAGGVQDYGRPASAAPSSGASAPMPSSSSVAPLPPTPVPSATDDSKPVVPEAHWTPAILWRTCQAAWTKREPGIDWSKFDPYDPAASGTDTSRKAIYVARYRTKTQPYDVRDCLITGVPDSYGIKLHPALDTD